MADEDTTADDGHTDETVDDESTDTDEGTEDDGAGEAAEDDWTPPTREDYEKLQATLKARNAKLAEARKRAAAAERRARGQASKAPAAPTKRKLAAVPADDDGDEDDTAAIAAEEAAAEQLRVTQVRTAAVGVVLAAGFNGNRKAAKDFVKLMDLSNVVPDAEGDVDDDDLADALDDLRERFPGMFEKPAAERRPPVRRPTTADRTPVDRKAPDMDPAARTTRKLLRQAGYR